MVQERLLEALLDAAPAAAPDSADGEGAPSSSRPPHPTEGGGGRDRSLPATPVPMDVEDQGGGAGGSTADEGVERGAATSAAADTAQARGGAVPTAVQVVASMVDGALEVSEEELGAACPRARRAGPMKTRLAVPSSPRRTRERRCRPCLASASSWRLGLS